MGIDPPPGHTHTVIASLLFEGFLVGINVPTAAVPAPTIISLNESLISSTETTKPSRGFFF